MENKKFVQDLQRRLYSYMYQDFSHVIILCVGTNKIVGDCVGPMVGQQLKTKLKEEEKIVVYGNMNETLNFKNAKQVIESISRIYTKPFVITVDSALGTEEMIEKVVVNEGLIQIGVSLGRSICYYSHINIKGIVGQKKDKPIDNMETLKKVKPELVMKLSNTVVDGIHQVISKIGIID